MTAKLAVTTVVPQPPGSGDGPVVLGPDDEVPDWALDLIGAHCFEGGVHPNDAKAPAKKAVAPKPA